MCRARYRVAAAVRAPLLQRGVAGCHSGGGPPEPRRASASGLDWLLRFQGEPGASRELEAAFGAYRARALRGHRTALISLLCAAFAAAWGVGVAQALRSGDPVPLAPGYFVYSCLCLLCAALVPAVRAVPRAAAPATAARPPERPPGRALRLLRWLISYAPELGAAACLLGVDPTGTAADSCSDNRLQFVGLLLLEGMPLACAVVFTPRWRVYVAVCVVHAARSFVELAPLGLLPPFLVFLACVVGAAGVYVFERVLREHFVRARPAKSDDSD